MKKENSKSAGRQNAFVGWKDKTRCAWWGKAVKRCPYRHAALVSAAVRCKPILAPGSSTVLVGEAGKRVDLIVRR